MLAGRRQIAARAAPRRAASDFCRSRRSTSGGQRVAGGIEDNAGGTKRHAAAAADFGHGKGFHVHGQGLMLLMEGLFFIGISHHVVDGKQFPTWRPGQASLDGSKGRCNERPLRSGRPSFAISGHGMPA